MTMALTKFITWNTDIRANAVKAIEALDPDLVFDITITKHVTSKTAEQRGWFHKLCALLGDELGMHSGDIKEIAKARLFGWRQVEYGGVTLTLADGSSERLNAKRYGQLIEVIYMLAGDSGIVLPEADKYRRSE